MKVKNKFLGALLAMLAFSSVASAEETKHAKPFSCTNFTTATTADGAKIGICGASKPGGKATFLRSYAIVDVVDPSTDKPVKVMTGYR